MKTLLIVTSLIFLISCSKNSSVEPTQEMVLEGSWQLFKVTNGFAQFEQTGSEIGFTESIIIDSNSKTFRRTRNSKEVLNSSFKIEKEGGRDAIVLIDDDSYHWFVLSKIDDEYVLSLYQNAPVGAILADGSDFEYKKVK